MEKKNILSYRPDIDGLRAIAVLFVILFHAFPDIFPGGYIGVDIFFVISGFLISGILFTALKTDSFSYSWFYSRRIKRLFPALIVVLLCSLVFGWLTLFPDEYSSLGKHTAAGTIFISNFLSYNEGDYFDGNSIFRPLLHLWSLGIEEQFYIFWPFLLVLLYRKRNALLSVICTLIMLSFLSAYGNSISGYLPIVRIWELMFGALLSYIIMYNDGISNYITNFTKKKLSTKNVHLILEAFGYIGISLVIISVFSINHASSFSALVLLLAIIGTFLILAAGQGTVINRLVLSNKPMVFVGLISYPLYLWHYPLLSFARIINSEPVPVFVTLILIVASFILAWLTYRFIEKPIRTNKSNYIVPVLVGIMFIIGTFGVVIFVNNGFSSRINDHKQLLNSIKVKTSGLNYERELCMKTYQLDIEKKNCLISGNSTQKIFIIGDSHARAIFVGYNKQITDMGYTVINLGAGGCSTLKAKRCRERLIKVMDRVLAENPKAIIISNNAGIGSHLQFEKSMREILYYLPNNITILWFLQYPQKQDLDPTACMERPFLNKYSSNNCIFTRAEWDKRMKGKGEIIKRLRDEFPKVIIIDPTEVLCNKKYCPIIIDNKYVYEDPQYHLSIYGSEFLANNLPITKHLLELNNSK